MSGPFLPARSASPIDLLVDNAASGGWEELDLMMKRPEQKVPLQPDAAVAEFMYGLYCTPQGRQMFEWMMDISIRQPLRATGRTFEETALLTATRQGVNGMAEAVLAAIQHGEELVRERKPQNGAGS
ncbi:hypothetical protein [Shinella kummerowiae]|uniref:hypothetical protein n=1 Tax=Shinella kummerowiae TaxID=417745 RepID=UPI0021B658ED|nr:hypothetical protein [Shinella kummerowiae]MCT7662331.1 hypothetical protein [Shinella kummerowiae]